MNELDYIFFVENWILVSWSGMTRKVIAYLSYNKRLRCKYMLLHGDSYYEGYSDE